MPSPGALSRALPARPGASLLQAALAAALLAAPVRAHQFWIELSPARPAEGELLRLDLRVGERFQGEPVARDGRRIVLFAATGPDGQAAPVLGRDGEAPAGFFRPARAGVHAVAYVSNDTYLELPGQEFEAYLLEEGLEAVSALRAERGESRRSGREKYSRSAKALVVVGATEDGGWSRRLGLPVELVPERSPFRSSGDGELTVRLFAGGAEGAPLAGCRLTALRRDAPAAAQVARTDGDGRASFGIAERGDWIVHGVTMAPAEGDPQADWKSTWTSLTWRVEAG